MCFVVFRLPLSTSRHLGLNGWWVSVLVRTYDVRYVCLLVLYVLPRSQKKQYAHTYDPTSHLLNRIHKYNLLQT